MHLYQELLISVGKILATLSTGKRKFVEKMHTFLSNPTWLNFELILSLYQ